MLRQEFTKDGLPSMRPYLQYLLDRDIVKHDKIKWGKTERQVIITGGKKYQYKGGDEINKNLKKKIVSLYIDMFESSNRKSKNSKDTYRSTIKEQLEKLKTNSIQNVKVDLTKINIQTLANDLGKLSDDVKLFMKLSTANRYYALNDRTINLVLY